MRKCLILLVFLGTLAGTAFAQDVEVDISSDVGDVTVSTDTTETDVDQVSFTNP